VFPKVIWGWYETVLDARGHDAAFVLPDLLHSSEYLINFLALANPAPQYHTSSQQHRRKRVIVYREEMAKSGLRVTVP
jgi:hypothetical protein